MIKRVANEKYRRYIWRRPRKSPNSVQTQFFAPQRVQLKSVFIILYGMIRIAIEHMVPLQYRDNK